ncbi:hypothetical protein [Phormidium sp. CCY1219]|nr:hypothetical protein [Phormidium sp. CCY1219]
MQQGGVADKLHVSANSSKPGIGSAYRFSEKRDRRSKPFPA